MPAPPPSRVPSPGQKGVYSPRGLSPKEAQQWAQPWSEAAGDVLSSTGLWKLGLWNINYVLSRLKPFEVSRLGWRQSRVRGFQEPPSLPGWLG